VPWYGNGKACCIEWIKLSVRPARGVSRNGTHGHHPTLENGNKQMAKAKVKALKYKIRVKRDKFSVLVEAVPNQWADNIQGIVECVEQSRQLKEGGPFTIKCVGWSTGARTHTTDEAREFFYAGLGVMARLDEELGKLQYLDRESKLQTGRVR